MAPQTNTNRRPRSPRRESQTREFEQKIIDIRRVVRVIAGGRRFSFRVTLVIGDKNGRVGVGLGKSSDTATAIEKAYNNARKNIVTLPLTDTGSLPHDVESKFGSARVLLKPTPKGGGLVAGGPVRVILELGGVTDVTGKILSGSKNKLNNARSTMEAFKHLKAPVTSKGKE